MVTKIEIYIFYFKANGTPVVISGVITYCITNSKKAFIDMSNPHKALHNLALAALK